MVHIVLAGRLKISMQERDGWELFFKSILPAFAVIPVIIFFVSFGLIQQEFKLEYYLATGWLISDILVSFFWSYVCYICILNVMLFLFVAINYLTTMAKYQQNLQPKINQYNYMKMVLVYKSYQIMNIYANIILGKVILCGLVLVSICQILAMVNAIKFVDKFPIEYTLFFIEIATIIGLCLKLLFSMVCMYTNESEQFLYTYKDLKWMSEDELVLGNGRKVCKRFRMSLKPLFIRIGGFMVISRSTLPTIEVDVVGRNAIDLLLAF